jgi:demethylmenaquinone methyltransferase/2-methoxy-6-polyprenyl-1,4-benzoquinol methylase
MPYRSSFACLWCGRPWSTRGPDDLEGYAQLCPDCIGRAGENNFLRFRLRTALGERAASGPVPPGPGGHASAAGDPAAGGGAPVDLAAEMVDYYEARAAEYDDWYLRRGRYAHGPIHDQAWTAELDAATLWLDRQPLAGEIVELAAGTGWWSPLLASKGDLSIYDAASAPLDLARDRLLAHGLRAHIHVRDAWAEPDRAVDVIFCGFWLSHVPRTRLGAFLGLARRWLRPGGSLLVIDSRPDPSSGALDQPATSDAELADGIVRRRLADGREFRVVKVLYTPDELEAAFLAAGFRAAEMTSTPRFFVLGRAEA